MKRDELHKRIAFLEQQNAFLQANLAAKESGAMAPATPADLTPTRSDFNNVLPESVRDEAAVGALIRQRFHVIYALRDMGYPVDAMPYAETMALARELFDNDRVRLILQESRRALERAKDDLIAAQVQDGLYGDPETRSRAFTALAKIGGWNKAQKVDLRTAGISFHTMLKDGPDSIMGALDAFSHEPGAPVKAGVLGAARSSEPVGHEQKTQSAHVPECHALRSAETDDEG